MQVGAVAVRRSGGLVMALEDVWLADLDGSNQRLFVPVERDNPRNRMNDGKCDCEGRFWAGTMAGDLTAGAGNLCRLDRDGRVYKMIEDVTLSNGLGWSPDSRRSYFIDSLAAGIDVFDFDPDGGQLSHRRRLVEIPTAEGLADGLCLDAEGFLWVALWGGGQVRRYSPGESSIAR